MVETCVPSPAAFTYPCLTGSPRKMSIKLCCSKCQVTFYQISHFPHSDGARESKSGMQFYIIWNPLGSSWIQKIITLLFFQLKIDCCNPTLFESYLQQVYIVAMVAYICCIKSLLSTKIIYILLLWLYSFLQSFLNHNRSTLLRFSDNKSQHLQRIMPWTKDQDTVYFVEPSQWICEVTTIISPILELSN